MKLNRHSASGLPVVSVHGLQAHRRTDRLVDLAIVSYAKECDAQGRDKHALAKFLTVH